MAAKKAFVTNRIGDFGFLIAIFLMFWAFGSLQFGEVFEAAHHVGEESPTVILLITLFMLVGVTGKSSQLPLYVWLPDAMAGPTPVSALIHAATMVTAGVYLVARSAPLYEAAPVAQNTVALVGGLTALFAATIAVGQFDIKKVLAYSTISQLGFMVAAVGMGAFVAGMFHLVTHAFFKALLFLSAGSVIIGLERGHHPLESAGDGGHAGDHHEDHDHAEEHGHLFDPNDMRNMGGLRKKMPTTFWVYLAGALALSGLPPLAGFFSKDEILAEASLLNPPVYILLTIAAFFTAFYMGRQVWMVFFGSPRSEGAEQAKESPAVMTVPLVLLAVFSVIGGALNLPGVHWFTDWLEHTLEHAHAGEFNVLVAGISTGLALLAIFLAWLLYGRIPLQKGQPDPLRRMLGPIFVGMENKWWVDELYWAVILNPYIALAKFLADIVDWRFWHDWFHDSVLFGTWNALTRWSALSFDLGFIDAIANGLGDGTQTLAAGLRQIQTGFVRNYALSVFLGVVVLVGYLILR
jgi:NADH-quinone oxidoreductase subunit L